MWEQLERREIRRRAPRAGTEGQEGVTGHRPRPDLPTGTDLLPSAFRTPPGPPRPTLRWGSWPL
jgi:hypothetical protein